jgi:hypothetical protein
MLLRRITEHVKEQNWFAVVLDFIIVIVGILIAFQITNWNDERNTKVVELATIEQIEIEFTEIRAELVKQIEVRETWVNDLGMLIASLETNTQANDMALRAGLDSATATGRRPASSAAYLQLMANGGLTLLSSDALKQALVRYHVRLDRDAFIHPELMNLVLEELSENKYVDRNVLSRTRATAAIDSKTDQTTSANDIKSYDLQGLRTLENRYEAMYTLHINLLAVDEVQLDIANEILGLIEKGRL